MASRRVKSTLNSHYVQPLKLRTGRSVVLPLSSNYTSVLFTKAHRAFYPSDIVPEVYAKFNSTSLDGIQLFAFLSNKGTPISIGDASFKVYSISLDGLWTETLITTTLATIGSNRAVATLTGSQLQGITLDSEVTLAVEVFISRRSDTYTKKVYVNHLGVYDSIIRLRQEVEFLDITKVDE